MIRHAVPSDIQHLLALFKKHHAAMGCSWAFDPARLNRTLLQAIANPAEWLCLAGDDCFFLAACFESPLGAGKIATELCFCVTPGNLDAVLKLYEDWARRAGCRALSLSCEQRFSAFERLYRRYGYRQSEMTTSKVL